MGWERAGGEAVGLFDAVILDHDGTIVDSRDAMVRSYTRWAGEYGVNLNEMPKYIDRVAGIGIPYSTYATFTTDETL
ncbi:MAG: hypothetical protein ACFN3I_04715, partial [Arachnia propionica]